MGNDHPQGRGLFIHFSSPLPNCPPPTDGCLLQVEALLATVQRGLLPIPEERPREFTGKSYIRNQPLPFPLIRNNDIPGRVRQGSLELLERTQMRLNGDLAEAGRHGFNSRHCGQ